MALKSVDPLAPIFGHWEIKKVSEQRIFLCGHFEPNSFLPTSNQACFSNLFLFLPFQSGDGYLVGLATRYSAELRTNYGDVLQQLEDLRLAEWSDHAPPPPLAPGTTSTASDSRTSYVNYPSSGQSTNEPIYVPGSYLVSPCLRTYHRIFIKANSLWCDPLYFQPSSCLSDRDGDQIYDYASKYRAQMRHHQAKMLMTPQGYVFVYFMCQLFVYIAAECWKEAKPWNFELASIFIVL